MLLSFLAHLRPGLDSCCSVADLLQCTMRPVLYLPPSLPRVTDVFSMPYCQLEGEWITGPKCSPSDRLHIHTLGHVTL